MKVNIVFSDTLKPTGGPSGYLYNLYKSLKINSKIKDLNIISKGLAKNNTINVTRKKNSIKNFFKKLEKIIKTKYMPINFRIKKKKLQQTKKYYTFFKQHEETLLQADINHFHTTIELYYFNLFYPNYQGKLVLTSHSPQVPYSEDFDYNMSIGYSIKQSNALVQYQKEIDIISFKKADYIIFPCQEAIEPYKFFLETNNICFNKFKYTITTSEPLQYSLNSKELRKKYNIPQNSILLCYIGRKNKIKGYDIFCEIAKLLKNNTKFFFISAGSGTISSPKQSNFIDIGWTNDPGSIINASDCIIIPNRNTYFDLNTIQALSLGKLIVTTYTGGNKWFKNKDVDIIFFKINNLNNLIEKLYSIKNMGKKNKIFFEKNLSNKYFAPNYQNVYKEIFLEK